MLDYPKPTDLSHVPGLIAAYNMVPSPGGILTDISGNGNNGDIESGIVSTKNGILISGTQEIVIPSVSLSEFSICQRVKIEKIDGAYIQFLRGNKYIMIDAALGTIFARDSLGVAVGLLTHGNVDLGKEFDYVITRTSDNTWILYINGVLEDTETDPAGSNLNIGYIGSSVNPGILEHIDLKIFDYILTEQQAIDYHNSFAKQVNKKIGFNEGVGSVI